MKKQGPFIAIALVILFLFLTRNKAKAKTSSGVVGVPGTGSSGVNSTFTPSQAVKKTTGNTTGNNGQTAKQVADYLAALKKLLGKAGRASPPAQQAQKPTKQPASVYRSKPSIKSSNPGRKDPTIPGATEGESSDPEKQQSYYDDLNDSTKDTNQQFDDFYTYGPENSYTDIAADPGNEFGGGGVDWGDFSDFGGGNSDYGGGVDWGDFSDFEGDAGGAPVSIVLEDYT